MIPTKSLAPQPAPALAATASTGTPGAQSPAVSLHLCVHHGGAHFSDFPLMLPVLANGERSRTITTLNALWGGAFDRMLRDRAWPSPGSSRRRRLEPGAGQRARPPSIALLGLSSNVTRLLVELRSATTAAVMDGWYGLDWQRHGGADVELTVGTLVPDFDDVPGAPSLDDRVAALVDGVLAACHQIHDEQGVPVRATLVFHELYRDVATRIAAAVHELRRGSRWATTPNVRLDAKAMIRGEGYRHDRPLRPGFSGVAVRALVSLDIFAGKMTCELLGTDAGEIPSTTFKLPRSLQTWFERRASATSWDEAVSEGLSTSEISALLPTELRKAFENGNDVALTVTPATAAFPWEISARALCATDEPSLVMRTLRVAGDRRASNTSKRALVIGDPDGTLPYATIEAQAIAAELRALGYQVDLSFFQSDATKSPAIERVSSITAYANLRRGEYSIVHIAAHGQKRASANNGDEAEHDLAPRVFLDQDIEIKPSDWRLFERAPSIVWLNCCEAGNVGWEPMGVPPSLTETIVSSGVRVFVGAAWKINDDTAMQFSRRAYQELARGRSLGASLRIARRIVGGDLKTLDAYQVYGDSQFVLQRDGHSTEMFVAASQVESALISGIGELRESPKEKLSEISPRIRGATSVARDRGWISDDLAWHSGQALLDIGD